MAIAASLLSGAGAALAQSDGAVPTAPPASTTPAIPAPLTLSSAIAEALAANPIARSAGYQAAQAEARLGQAEAQRRLQFSFSSTAGGSNVDVYQPPPAHETFGSLQNSVTLPIPIGSRPRLVVTQSREQVRAAQAQLQGARVALAAQVVTAYYDLLKKQALAAIAQDTLAQAQRQQAEAQKRFRAGDVPELDAIRAQVPVASAQASLAQMETDVAIARQTLNGLLGRPLAAPVSVEDVPATLAGIDLTPESALSQALANNAEVCAADATIRANTAALAAARRYRDPSLSLQAIHNRSGDKTGFSREDSLQATISLPLSDGGLGAAQVREATAALAQSQGCCRGAANGGDQCRHGVSHGAEQPSAGAGSGDDARCGSDQLR